MTNTQMKRRSPKRRGFAWYGGNRRGSALVTYGAIWFGIGLLITIGSYVFAASRRGGTYLVSYGPMAVGAVSIVRGFIHIARDRRAGAAAPGSAGRLWPARLRPAGLRPAARLRPAGLRSARLRSG